MYKNTDYQKRKGSRSDPFWNGTVHTCCGSLTPWLHKKGCTTGDTEVDE